MCKPLDPVARHVSYKNNCTNMYVEKCILHDEFFFVYNF